jgi:ATP-dependent Clp protease protease subunit
MNDDALPDLSQLHDHGLYPDCNLIYLHGPITEDSASRFIRNLDALTAGSDCDHLIVSLMTEGGDFYPAMAIFDAVLRCNFKTTAIVDGYCMSAGAVILQAFEERLIRPHGTIMIHDGVEAFEGTPDDSKAWGRYNGNMTKKMHQLFADRTGKTVRIWKNRCKSDYIVDAREALAQHLVDNIIE